LRFSALSLKVLPIGRKYQPRREIEQMFEGVKIYTDGESVWHFYIDKSGKPLVMKVGKKGGYWSGKTFDTVIEAEWYLKGKRAELAQ
jgi:hypothetical protein